MPRKITVRPLTRKAFEPFGDIVEADSGSKAETVNDGYATRYHDLGRGDVSEAEGRPLINIFRGRPRPLPLTIHMMERHPLASQAFIPLHNKPFVVVVAPPADTLEPNDLSAFITNGRQGGKLCTRCLAFPSVST